MSERLGIYIGTGESDGGGTGEPLCFADSRDQAQALVSADAFVHRGDPAVIDAEFPEVDEGPKPRKFCACGQELTHGMALTFGVKADTCGECWLKRRRDAGMGDTIGHEPQRHEPPAVETPHPWDSWSTSTEES